MTTQQQTDIRLAATEMVLRLQEFGGGGVDVHDTEDLIEKSEHLYMYLTKGVNIYAAVKAAVIKPKEGE